MDGNNRGEVVYFGEVVPVTCIHAWAPRVGDHDRSITAWPAHRIVDLDSVEHYIIFTCIQLRHGTSWLDKIIIHAPSFAWHEKSEWKFPLALSCEEYYKIKSP